MSNGTVVETKIFIGTVIEKVEVRHATSGIHLRTDREPIIFGSPIVAVDVNIAMADLLGMALEIKPKLDKTMLETKLVPFVLG